MKERVQEKFHVGFQCSFFVFHLQRAYADYQNHYNDCDSNFSDFITLGFSERVSTCTDKRIGDVRYADKIYTVQ